MPKRVVLQPNGKLALFSTIVDHFVMYDATPDKMIYDLMHDYNLGPTTAWEKVDRGVKDLDPWTNKAGGGRSRWDTDVWTAIVLHGPNDAELLEVMVGGGMKPDEIKHWQDLAIKARSEIERQGYTNIKPK
jgi:hypothetical protein